MNVARLSLEESLRRLPREWPEDPLPIIQRALSSSREKVVVLDDDPTGTQTVHGVPVLTEWSVDALCSELVNDLPAFYLLTNSRSVSLEAARSMNYEIGRNLVAAAQRVGRRFVVVSRSDSTLRGHFPGEVESLDEGLGGGFDAWLLVPFFQDGGRYTINDLHYVAEGEWLVPAGETEFARDTVFGYHSSNLREWVEEKTGGRISSGAVASISIEEIRVGGPKRVTERLLALHRGTICIANAASTCDLEVFTQGLLDAEARGRRFLYRTAASFVSVRAGLKRRPLLAPAELSLPASGGGLVIVGSHVPRTTAQVESLLSQQGVIGVEVSVEALLSDATKHGEVGRVVGLSDEGLRRGEDVVVFTNRRLFLGDSVHDNLSIGRRVSDGLIAVVRGISAKPRYLLAKGGITASDVATKGLGVKRALVLGQISPGVPVWKLGSGSSSPGSVYVVFPGNVGGPEALTGIVKKLRVGAGQ